ncbi:MAG: carbon storage regulator [Fuerstiella sp.]
MLKFSRKSGEGFAINEETFIWITKTSNGRCEIAIQAPQDQRVRRCELPVKSEHWPHQTAADTGVPA